MRQVLVDTTVWSLALRRHRDHLNEAQRRLVIHLGELVTGGRTFLISPIRQEILSGVRHRADFDRLRIQLDGVNHLTLVKEDYDQAALFFSLLQQQGVHGGSTDLLLGAVAYRYDMDLFTTDRDFEKHATHLPIRLHKTA